MAMKAWLCAAGSNMAGFVLRDAVPPSLSNVAREPLDLRKSALLLLLVLAAASKLLLPLTAAAVASTFPLLPSRRDVAPLLLLLLTRRDADDVTDRGVLALLVWTPPPATTPATERLMSGRKLADDDSVAIVQDVSARYQRVVVAEQVLATQGLDNGQGVACMCGQSGARSCSHLIHSLSCRPDA